MCVRSPPPRPPVTWHAESIANGCMIDTLSIGYAATPPLDGHVPLNHEENGRWGLISISITLHTTTEMKKCACV